MYQYQYQWYQVSSGEQLQAFSRRLPVFVFPVFADSTWIRDTIYDTFDITYCIQKKKSRDPEYFYLKLKKL